MIDSTVCSTITAIIVAGGASSRMGRDKALISLQGKLMLWYIGTLASQYAQHLVQELPVSDRQVLFNCKTPKQLAQINQMFVTHRVRRGNKEGLCLGYS